MSIFYDVDAFMKAAGHGPDPKKVSLYLDLVREEIAELEQAMSDYHAAEDRKSTRLNSSHVSESRMPSSA